MTHFEVLRFVNTILHLNDYFWETEDLNNSSFNIATLDRLRGLYLEGNIQGIQIHLQHDIYYIYSKKNAILLYM